MTRRRCASLAAVAGASLLVSALANAVPITVNFDADAQGPVADGFQSAGAPGVSFFDTVGADLLVLSSGGSNALGVPTDQDGGALEMRFAFGVDMLSLVFGNDQASNTNAGDLAMLVLFMGNAELARTSLALNRNGLLDQAISFGAIGSATIFDRAIFAFTNPDGSPFTGGGAANIGLSELVDNIFLNSVERVLVAEPGTLVLMLAGLAAIALGRRRRSH